MFKMTVTMLRNGLAEDESSARTAALTSLIDLQTTVCVMIASAASDAALTSLTGLKATGCVMTAGKGSGSGVFGKNTE